MNIVRTLSISCVGLWFGCFALLPIMLMVVMSFMTPSMNGLVVWHLTLNNYSQLANDVFFKIFIHLMRENENEMLCVESVTRLNYDPMSQRALI